MARRALWSAATCRRFLAGVQRPCESESGDKSPHSKGARLRLAALLALAMLALVFLAPIDRAWSLARNSILLAAAVVAVSLPVGTLAGWLLARTDLAGRRVMLVLFGLMLFVPLYLQAAAWQAGFGVQGWCTLAGGGPDSWKAGRARPGSRHGGDPLVVLITAVGFAIDPELEELKPAGRLAREGLLEHLAAGRPVGPGYGRDLGGDPRAR